MQTQRRRKCVADQHFKFDKANKLVRFTARLARCVEFVLLLALTAAAGQKTGQEALPDAPLTQNLPAAAPGITVGGAPPVMLKRPPVTDKSKPQFLEATILPGRGMDVLQIKAYLPGKGETDLLNSPSLEDAARLLGKDNDVFGNQVFKFGGAILLPFANRIRGEVAPDGKTITAMIAGRKVILPANWSGNNPGAEKHAIHGLMQRSHFQNVITRSGAQESAVTATLNAGNFDGHWLSDTDVEVQTVLSYDAFDLTVTAKNVGPRPLPMGIGWHPYFVHPGGDRQEVRLHLPSETRAVVNNYDDSFPTGRRIPVKGTDYDFSAPDGRALGTQYLDDNYSVLNYDQGKTVTELIDPGAKYGLRLITLTPKIKSIQVYAPPDKNFVAIEPQFNLPDPYNKNWGNLGNGMVLVQPGESVTWRVRLELFTPKE